MESALSIILCGVSSRVVQTTHTEILVRVRSNSTKTKQMSCLLGWKYHFERVFFRANFRNRQAGCREKKEEQFL